MKLPFLLLLPVLALCSCAAPGTRTDPRDFAVSSCELTPQAIALAQKRARGFVGRYPAASGDLRLLAVQADYVFPNQPQDLWEKLFRSETSSSAYAQRRGQTYKLWCIALIDRSTLLPETNQGYLLSNTPARGEIVNIGGRRVLYVGRGN